MASIYIMSHKTDLVCSSLITNANSLVNKSYIVCGVECHQTHFGTAQYIPALQFIIFVTSSINISMTVMH